MFCFETYTAALFYGIVDAGLVVTFFMRFCMKDTGSILSRYPDYEVNIGIEVHVQLTTQTKIFCTCLKWIFRQAQFSYLPDLHWTTWSITCPQ